MKRTLADRTRARLKRALKRALCQPELMIATLGDS
jgi:hypothetical protein